MKSYGVTIQMNPLQYTPNAKMAAGLIFFCLNSNQPN